MKDLLLTEDGDLYISKDSADIEFTDSVIQAITVRLKWFKAEWRINTNYGLPYYDEVFIKNPNTTLIASRLKKEILKVTEVSAVNSITVSIDKATRTAQVNFNVTVNGETEDGEVVLDV